MGQPHQAGEFAMGQVKRIHDLAASRLRQQLQGLPGPAQDRALQWLRSFHFTAADLEHLHADREGGIFYVCGGAVAASAPLATFPTSDLTVPISPFPANLKFHSRPGAPNILYLNFTGETVVNTQWNTELARTEIPAVAFSADEDLTSFSDAEQAIIKRIWQRVAEDYAPFNIDVTTERPASFTTRTAMALITRTTDANGAPNPYNTAGGVSYVNVFGTTSYANYRPAWIYHGNLGNTESYIAEATSHEIGHNLGLSHDGRTDGAEYYGGHGSGDISWGPIMGTGYNRNVSQWSKGEYYLASNTQDDLATIAGKISYLTDDHGNTAGGATMLVIAGGTNIVATTPENDPARTNTANKGILERSADVDVFSFITGSGPIQLNVSPWVSPVGTSGGNLDIHLSLYNDAGVLLLTNNADGLTYAVIETNLAEGRYYLHVRGSSAGDPFAATPTGYTVYGSLGQYFINGFITEATSFVPPPVAELNATDVTLPDQTNRSFTVTYSDNLAVDASTLDSSDIRITGPSGYDRLARLLSVSSSTDGTPRTATYAAEPPAGGVWLPAHNGLYLVWMQRNQVGDTEGAWVADGLLGQFRVAVPVAIYSANMDADPGWTLQPQWQYGTPAYSGAGPTGGFTGTRIVAYNLTGNYANNLNVKYATAPLINASSTSMLTLRFRRWLRTRQNDTASIQVSTNGTVWTTVWTSSSAVADTAWQQVQYTLPASVAGSASLKIRWGLQSNQALNDIGWNIDDVELLGDAVLDAEPPVPSLSVGDLTVAGSPSHSCSVTFTDATAVRLASLDSMDLAVTGPNGYTNLLEFIGADLPADGSPLTGSYAIPAPQGLWSAADNGTYTITLLEDEVEDTMNNLAPSNQLGTFIVAISTASPGVLEVMPAANLIAAGNVGGPFLPHSISYVLTNSGEASLTWTASKAQDWVELSNTGGTLAAGASTSLTVSLNTNANVLPAGTYGDTISFVNATTGAGNASRTVGLTVSKVGRLEIMPITDLVAYGTVGGPFTPAFISYTLTNAGGTALNWTASQSQEWVTLSTTGGNLAAGAFTNVTVFINTNANRLAAGLYTNETVITNLSDHSQVAATAVLLQVTPLLLSLSYNPAAAPCQFQLQGGANQVYVIEISSDLREWAGVATNTTTGEGILVYLDAEVPPPRQRFYRARPFP